MQDNRINTKKGVSLMLDTVIGPILNVISGDSFTMQVTHIGNHNLQRYGNYETVLIVNTPGVVNPNFLSRDLIGRRVRCKVINRDIYNRINAYVEIDTSK